MAASLKPLLNLDTFIETYAPNQQIMIYGTSTAKYSEITAWLNFEKACGRFQDVFDCFLGQMECSEEEAIDLQHKTTDGRIIHKIQHGSLDGYGKDSYKAGLVNLVVENVKRAKLGLPIIPVLFLIGKDHHRLIIEKKTITMGEINRAYKLCYDPLLSTEVNNVALMTFNFATLTSESSDAPFRYRIDSVETPWSDSKAWEAARLKRKIPRAPKRVKPYVWQKEVLRILSS